jgi:hypothetical protein
LSWVVFMFPRSLDALASGRLRFARVFLGFPPGSAQRGSFVLACWPGQNPDVARAGQAFEAFDTVRPAHIYRVSEAVLAPRPLHGVTALRSSARSSLSQSSAKRDSANEKDSIA